MKHVTTEVPSDINAKARLLAKTKDQTLSEFLTDVLTREVTRLWNNRPEEEGNIRTIVREELSRAFE
jgi:hypothetical protein